MVTNAEPSAAADGRLLQYRQAEQALWEHYGIKPTETFVDVRSPDARLRVIEWGSGDPVVFVGGTGGTGPYFAPLVRELSGFRCLLLDRPGWGLSSPVDYSKYEFKVLVADLLRSALDALAVERAHVVGASIGGSWALSLAARHPSRVDRIVQLGSGPIPAETQLTTFLRLLASPLGALVVRLPQKPGMMRKQLRGLGHGASVEAGRMDQFITWRVAFFRDTDSMHHERDMVRTLIRGRELRPGVAFADSELRTIEQPTLIVLGTTDPGGTVDVWERVVGILPRGELHLVEGAGHLSWFDNPGQVGGRVQQFLSA